MSFHNDDIGSSSEHQDMSADGNLLQENGKDSSPLNEKAAEYIRELLSEKIKLNNEKFPVTAKLIDEEVQKVQSTGRVPARDSKYADVFHEKPVKVTVKVLVPIKEFPKFNFVGKLLGPKGNTMKQLQENTLCKMSVLGRGSMRDKEKEETFRNSHNPKFAHLSDELHVEISALAPPAEAYARIAFALSEIKKCLIPDNEMMMPSAPMDRMGGLPRLGRPMPRMQPPPPPPPPMMHPMSSNNKVMSLLKRTRDSMMDSSYYNEPFGSMNEQVREPPLRKPMQREQMQRMDNEFYYDQEPFYEEENYYKEEAPARQFHSASVREVGTRRPPGGGHGGVSGGHAGGHGGHRFVRTSTITRPSPYARAAK